MLRSKISSDCICDCAISSVKRASNASTRTETCCSTIAGISARTAAVDSVMRRSAAVISSRSKASSREFSSIRRSRSARAWAYSDVPPDSSRASKRSIRSSKGSMSRISSLIESGGTEGRTGAGREYARERPEEKPIARPVPAATASPLRIRFAILPFLICVDLCSSVAQKLSHYPALSRGHTPRQPGVNPEQRRGIEQIPRQSSTPERQRIEVASHQSSKSRRIKMIHAAHRLKPHREIRDQEKLQAAQKRRHSHAHCVHVAHEPLTDKHIDHETRINQRRPERVPAVRAARVPHNRIRRKHHDHRQQIRQVAANTRTREQAGRAHWRHVRHVRHKAPRHAENRKPHGIRL